MTLPDPPSHVPTTPVVGYRNREHAGIALGEEVNLRLNERGDAVVLALPRGGVPVGLEVARTLRVPLDVMIVRKLGIPSYEEYAMGAVAAGGFCLLNHETIADLGLTEATVTEVMQRETAELKRREKLYRGKLPPVNVAGRTVILVDDGLATGFTMRAAVAAVRSQQPRRVFVAAPVGAPESCAALAREVDGLICPLQPRDFQAVGFWYQDFAPTTDAEVRACLAESPELDHELTKRAM